MWPPNPLQTVEQDLWPPCVPTFPCGTQPSKRITKAWVKILRCLGDQVIEIKVIGAESTFREVRFCFTYIKLGFMGRCGREFPQRQCIIIPFCDLFQLFLSFLSLFKNHFGAPITDHCQRCWELKQYLNLPMFLLNQSYSIKNRGNDRRTQVLKNLALIDRLKSGVPNCGPQTGSGPWPVRNAREKNSPTPVLPVPHQPSRKLVSGAKKVGDCRLK